VRFNLDHLWSCVYTRFSVSNLLLHSFYYHSKLLDNIISYKLSFKEKKKKTHA
jgi:hypothetical protein